MMTFIDYMSNPVNCHVITKIGQKNISKQKLWLSKNTGQGRLENMKKKRTKNNVAVQDT